MSAGPSEQRNPYKGSPHAFTLAEAQIDSSHLHKLIVPGL